MIQVDQELETSHPHTLNLRPHRSISHSRTTHPKTKILESKAVLMTYVCMYVCISVFGLHAHMHVCMHGSQSCLDLYRARISTWTI